MSVLSQNSTKISGFEDTKLQGLCDLFRELMLLKQSYHQVDLTVHFIPKLLFLDSVLYSLPIMNQKTKDGVFLSCKKL